MVKNFALCGCGRSVSGYCDGSHGIPPHEWQERTNAVQDNFNVYTAYPELPIDSDYKRIPYAQT